MYISVAWFWNLYIVMWKCVWCDTVRRSAAPHHILNDWELLFGVRSCAVGSVCVPYANSLMKFYFITIITNTKSMGTTRHCSLVTCTPSQSTELVLGVHCFGVEFNLCSFYKFLYKSLFHHDNYNIWVTTRHCSLVSSTPSQSIGHGFWVCVVLVFSVTCVPLANPLMKFYFIMLIILLCIISYETKFSHSFLIGLRCIFQLPGSGICIL